MVICKGTTKRELIQTFTSEFEGYTMWMGACHSVMVCAGCSAIKIE